MRVPRYARLLLRPPALDLETATWEMLYLFISPRRVYKSMQYRQQNKNQWARDDPSFIVVMSSLLVLSALAWGFAYAPSFLGVLRLVLYMVIVDFLAMGVIISTIEWAIASKLLLNRSNPGLQIEWGYSFDVHCNSFLVIWLYLYVVQFILLPVIQSPRIVSVFLGNLLYTIAISHYFVITFLGYSNLQILRNTQVFLIPIGLAVLLFFICTISRFSVVRFMLAQYFDL